MNLATAGWLACSNDPRSYASKSLMPLAGPTKLDRSLGEGPDKACIPVFQARGFDSRVTTVKNYLVMETAMKTSTTAMAFHSLQTCMDGSSGKLKGSY